MFRMFLFCLLPFWLSTDQPVVRPRHDYAVLFAVCDYQNPSLEDLKNPIQNAEAIAKELKEKYGFQVEVVKNPTLDQIDAKILAYKDLFARNPQGNYPPDGQLLFFFSGHGKIEGENGYFLPADANPSKLRNSAFMYSYWRGEINAIDCRHILVAVDACMSASFEPFYFDKQRITPDFGRKGELSESQKLLNNQDEKKTRIYLTSDSDGKETPDQSTFAKKWLDALKSSGGPDAILTATEIAAAIELAHPKPKYGHFGDDEDGSFLCVVADPLAGRKIVDETQTEQLAKDLKAYQTAKILHRIDAYRSYLSQFPAGEFREQALTAIQVLEDEANRRREDLAWEVAVTKNTIDAYRKYQSDYPNGQHEEDAKTQIAILNKPVKQPAKPVDRSTPTPPTDNMIFVQGATFQMGCHPERDGDCGSDETLHAVVVSDFYIGKTEVTQAEWRKVMGSDPAELYFKGCDNCPVEGVSWNDIQDFIQKLNQQTGRTYRLPTEAEWEFAARGGKQSKGYTYSGANIISDVAWYGSNSESKTHPVATKAPNELGIYDMTGNVFEWCSDWYVEDYYKKTAQKNPIGPTSGDHRVYRGGSWFDTPSYYRSAYRSGYTPTYRNYVLGFRLARQF